MGGVARKGYGIGRGIGLIDGAGQNTILRKMGLVSGDTTYATDAQFGIMTDATRAQSAAANAPPPQAPDLTDQMVRAAQRAEAMKLKTGRTRASTFKTGGAY